MVKGTTRRFVVGGLLAAQLLTVLVIVIATGRITERAKADHTSVMLDRAAAEAADHTRQYLVPAGSVVSAAADLIDGGAVDMRALERLFVGELQRSPQLSAVYVGGDDGSFFFVTRAGDGYLAQSTKWLHFGLGALDRIDRVVVTWPDGTFSSASHTLI